MKKNKILVSAFLNICVMFSLISPVWATSTVTIPITAENSAYVITTNNFGGVDYSGIYKVTENNIGKNEDIAVLKTTSGILYYNIDLSSVKEKSFTSAKLKFAVMSTGDSWFLGKLYKVTESPWNVVSTSGTNQPTCEATAFASKDYKFKDSTYIIPKYVYTYVEFDLTSQLQSFLAGGGNDFGIKIYNNETDGKGVYVKGPSTDMPPYVEFEGVEDGNYISFDGGTDSVGLMNSIEKAPSRSFNLPECYFEKIGYSFAGWNDGTSTYAAGASYTMPANDVTLTAVWNNTGAYNHYIPTEQSAYVVSATTWGNIPANYSVSTSTNNIEANDGIAVVRTTGVQRLYYKLDLSELRGKSFTSAKLKIASKRGDGSWLAGKISKTEDTSWDASTLNNSNAPAVLSTPAPVTYTYKTHSQSTYTYLEFDITSLLTNLQDDDYVVGIKFENTDGDGEGSFVKGPSTDMPPYIEFTGVTGASFPNFMQSGTEINELSSGNIKCQALIKGAKNTVAIPCAALYNDSETELIRFFSGTPFVLSGGIQCANMDIDISNADFGNSNKLKMFVWEQNDIVAISNAITLNKQ